MNSKSLRLIEDVVINSGKWVSLEMAQDSIYLHFIDVELGKPTMEIGRASCRERV